MAMRLTFIAYCFHQEGQSSTYMYVYTTFPENWTLLLHFWALSTSRRITPLYFAHRPSDGFFCFRSTHMSRKKWIARDCP